MGVRGNGNGNSERQNENDMMTEEEIQALRASVRAIVQRDGQQKVADDVGVARSVISKFINGKSVRSYNLQLLRDYVNSDRAGERNTAFYGRDHYAAIAAGMGAQTNNKEFIQRYSGIYLVLRTHVPSNLPLVSRLHIFGDPDNYTVRFRHEHAFKDELDVFPPDLPRPQTDDETEGDAYKIVYKGFVFHTSDRAFLLSADRGTGQIKEMILRLPASHFPAKMARSKTFLGLILTVSAEQRQPFAARVLVRQVVPDLFTNEELDQERGDDPFADLRTLCKPGFKSWESFPPTIHALFSKEENYGRLHLQPTELTDPVAMGMA